MRHNERLLLPEHDPNRAKRLGMHQFFNLISDHRIEITHISAQGKGETLQALQAKRYLVVADQCCRAGLQRLHAAIRHEPVFTGGLGHQFSPAGRHRRTQDRHQSHHRRAEVLPVGPVIKNMNP